MSEIGRENKKMNDLFYTCSLIEFIARKTKNLRSVVVNQLGKENIEKIYELADVYHCDSMEYVSEEFIEKVQMKEGNYNNVAECRYAIPSYWDIGKVYKRLIAKVAEEEEISVIDALIEVYNSFITMKIDDYNSSVYYENPSYIYECYKGKTMI